MLWKAYLPGAGPTGRVFLPGAPGIRGVVQWTPSWYKKTSAGTRAEGRGQDGSGKGVVWELAESHVELF